MTAPGVRALLADLATKGTLLLVTSEGWLLYGAGELSTAVCPACLACRGFYVVRQVLGIERVGVTITWAVSCLDCVRELPPGSWLVREQEPERQNPHASSR